ncbi:MULTISPECIES: AzlD family protein [Rhizobium/Agrobacterium group]|uniref:AzlD family protein n=1 Tax=Rhizobium/Agrobacterium group TaxID=227290 RepID=UPI002300B341|nr:MULTISPECIES: AzlD family protein [Rhizobium/Agrobacterium group]MDA5632469.1 AzlD family protein [Agrobacterium sp. ST15.16.024]MDF1888333.1 AzlD family protein [Rhizobium rhizogenes]
MTLDANTLLTILAMMAATVATRLGGLLLVSHFTLTPRLKKALGVVPPAVLMAVVTPTALASGPAETIACAVTAIAALRLSLLPAATLGVVTVALLRGIGL